MYVCKICDKKFDKRYSYIGHCSSHNRGESYAEKRKSKKIEPQKIKICEYCKEIFDNGFKLGGHKVNCKKNPEFEKNKLIKKKKLSKISKGKKLKDDHKIKISESRKKYLNDNPGKIPYLLNHSSKEIYPEKIFREQLENKEIKGWIQEYPIKRYSLDFAFLEKKIDIEIDGETHNISSVAIKDTERDITLSKMGWKIIRIKAKDIRNNIVLVMDFIMKELDSVA
jgi:very-short-patch-repair endonuclease